jgi:hypothetical protein
MATQTIARGPAQILAARAFARSLDTLLKCVRLHGMRHVSSCNQLELTWKSLRSALSGVEELLLGVSGSQLLVDGVPLEGGTAERALIDVLKACGGAHLQFLPSLTPEQFGRAVEVMSERTAETCKSRPAEPRPLRFPAPPVAQADAAGDAAARIRQAIAEASAAESLSPALIAELCDAAKAATAEIVVQLGQCQKRQQYEGLFAVLRAMGEPALAELRSLLTSPAAPEAVDSVGPLSRLDLPFLGHELPARVGGWSRALQHAAVRQLGMAGARGRGLLLTGLLPMLDPLLAPLAIDEIGLSGDTDAAPAMLQLAQGLGPAANNHFLRLKAIEALGRLRDPHAADHLVKLLTQKAFLGHRQPRELRIAAAQALRHIDARLAERVIKYSGLRRAELQLAPFAVLATEWTRSRRYPRMPARAINAVARTAKGRVELTLTGLSLGGGVALRKGRLPVTYEAVLEVASGLRRIHSQVLARELRPREVTFEIVNIALEDLARLRRLLTESAGATAAPRRSA